MHIRSATIIFVLTAAPKVLFARECEAPSEVLGNGECDHEYNIPDCSFDGGDCCESTCNCTASAVSSEIGNCAFACDDNEFVCLDPSENGDPAFYFKNSDSPIFEFYRSDSSVTENFNGYNTSLGETGVDRCSEGFSPGISSDTPRCFVNFTEGLRVDEYQTLSAKTGEICGENGFQFNFYDNPDLTAVQMRLVTAESDDAIIDYKFIITATPRNASAGLSTRTQELPLDYDLAFGNRRHTFLSLPGFILESIRYTGLAENPVQTPCATSVEMIYVAPTPAPTPGPTSAPTADPTASPTQVPTSIPTATPTAAPTLVPTARPTSIPTSSPSPAPTTTPTASPTLAPTATPTATPTSDPSAAPTPAPTVAMMAGSTEDDGILSTTLGAIVVYGGSCMVFIACGLCICMLRFRYRQKIEIRRRIAKEKRAHSAHATPARGNNTFDNVRGNNNVWQEDRGQSAAGHLKSPHELTNPDMSNSAFEVSYSASSSII